MTELTVYAHAGWCNRHWEAGACYLNYRIPWPEKGNPTISLGGKAIAALDIVLRVAPENQSR